MSSTLGQIDRLRLVAIIAALACVSRAPALAQVTFTDEAAAAGLGYVGETDSIAWGDYNGDGYEDLYVSQRATAGGLAGATYLRNQLYRNNGDGTFTDVAPALGLDLDGDNRTALWADYDNDGDLDLYVSRQDALNALFRNDGGSFNDVADSAGLQDDPTGRAYGAAWADYDGDGYLDLFSRGMRPQTGCTGATGLGSSMLPLRSVWRTRDQDARPPGPITMGTAISTSPCRSLASPASSTRTRPACSRMTPLL